MWAAGSAVSRHPRLSIEMCFLQVLVVSAVAAMGAGLADANLPLESGRSRGDEHTAAGAESGLGQENDAKLPVGTSGAKL